MSWGYVASVGIEAWCIEVFRGMYNEYYTNKIFEN